ncbi:MAG: hypothetical protein KDB53_03045, partial [Planctomycetes bacterium]|nr:hypothetical protein [Planctomycetota bacterium]
MIDRERLVEQITEQVWQKLRSDARQERDRVCSDCTGTCATRCAFKVPAFVDAGAARVAGGLGMGRVKGDLA